MSTSDLMMSASTKDKNHCIHTLYNEHHYKDFSSWSGTKQLQVVKKQARVLQKVSDIWRKYCKLLDGKSTLIPMTKSGCNNSRPSELPNCIQSKRFLLQFSLDIFISTVSLSMWPSLQPYLLFGVWWANRLSPSFSHFIGIVHTYTGMSIMKQSWTMLHHILQ